jgi:hypothetical protein
LGIGIVFIRRRHLHFFLAGCAAGLAACSTPLPAQTTTVDAALNITEISVESNCFGCASGSTLTLHRDGRALLTSTGSARHGTADQQRLGRIAAADFEALARLLLAQGFFALADSYADPALQDGAWATVRATRGGQVKQVFRRGDAAPAALRTIEAALAAAQARIRFGS